MNMSFSYPLLLWRRSKKVHWIFLLSTMLILWNILSIRSILIRNVSFISQYSSSSSSSWSHEISFSSSLTTWTSPKPMVMIACNDTNCLDFVSQKYLTTYSWIHPFLVHPNQRLILETAYEIYNQKNIENSPAIPSASSSVEMQHSWIGMASFTQLTNLNMSLVEQMLLDDHRIDKDVDILAFIDLSQSEYSLSKYIEETCPGMMEVLTSVLIEIGEDTDKVACMNLPYPAFQVFHGDFFVARPTLWTSYIEWLRPVIHLLENRTTSSSISNTTTSSCIPSHLHLLASYYFNANMAKVITNKEYQKWMEPDETSWTLQKFIAQEFNAETMSKISLKPKNTPLVFVLAHSLDTAQEARQKYSSYTWANPYYIPSTYFFETFFYSNILGDMLEDFIKSRNTTWVGSIAWKADSKTDIALVDAMLLDTDIDADVLAFVRVPYYSLWEQADNMHPGLMDVMVYILHSTGEPMDNIEKMKLMAPGFTNFFCTYFTTRPHIMRLYIEWLSNIMHFINTDRKAQNMIWRDSSYGGDMGPARIIYNLPFYPMHAFIGERLVQYFFNSRGYKILQAADYATLKGI